MRLLSIEQAIDGFILDKEASGKSPYTIRNYLNTFKKVQAFMDAHKFSKRTPITELDHEFWRGFFVWLQGKRFELNGVAYRPPTKLAPKSICNIHTDLSAFYTWATREGVVEEHQMQRIERPKYELPVIEPFTKEQIEALLEACDYNRPWRSHNTQSRRGTAERDRAIVMLLLSTGVRASELCNAKMRDIDMKARSLHVVGKGDKPRMVYFGQRTRRSIWRYLTSRDDDEPFAPLFTVVHGQEPHAFNRDVLRKLISRLGNRAAVPDCHPHRFRHTFAITYLRNGGDVLTLQSLLGHSSLEMVRHYAKIASTDCKAVHQVADPVDNWGL